jgi:ApaG protein
MFRPTFINVWTYFSIKDQCLAMTTKKTTDSEKTPLYHAATEGVHVYAEPLYLADQSDPKAPVFVWAYFIRIRNERKDKVKLLRRYWQIIDAKGHRIEVKGDGVVGLQPSLEPGETFQYNSGTHLETASGIMRGRYTMVDESGAEFDIEIPAFSLDTDDTQLIKKH